MVIPRLYPKNKELICFSEKLSRLLSEVDANNDGHIDEEEFEKLVQLRQDDTR